MSTYGAHTIAPDDINEMPPSFWATPRFHAI